MEENSENKTQGHGLLIPALLVAGVIVLLAVVKMLM